MAITITPVRRLMSASRRLRPARALDGVIKSSSISISTLDRLVTSSANSTAAGLVSSETIRCAPIAAGMTMWSAPACLSFLGVLGPSARETITRLGHICRAVKVMNTFSASLGMTHHQDLGAFDAGLLQDVFLGCIAGHDREPAGFGHRRPFMRQIDDDERLFTGGQLVADQPAQAAEARDDRVAGQRLNVLRHAVATKVIEDLALGEELHE